MLREGWSPPPVHLNIISGQGGLGDTLARLPAFRYMHDEFPHVSSCIYIQDGWLDLVKFLLPETDRRKYRPYSEARHGMKKPMIVFEKDRLTTLNLHLTDHAFLILMDMLPPSQEAKAYVNAPYVTLPLNEKFLPTIAKETVIFTTDYTAPSRQWPAVHINALAKKCLEAGLQPVLLGTTEPIPTGAEADDIIPRQTSGLNANRFIDLRDKTSLLEALGIIQRAKAVVGVDNGLLHLAHCTDTPVVMGFTSLKPEHRVPVRIGNPLGMDLLAADVGLDVDEQRLRRGAQLTSTIEAKVPCKGCQSRGFAINHDWRTCLFDDYACTLTLSADRFWTRLQRLGVVD